MRKLFRAGILIVLLVIPALIFIFLKIFATNHYDLPYYNPTMDSTGSVLRLMATGDTLYDKVSTENLMLPSGKPLAEDIFKDKFTAVTYLPAHCDEPCKIQFDRLGRIFELTNQIQGFQLLSITDSLQANYSTYSPQIGKPGWNVAVFLPEFRESVMLQNFKFQTLALKQQTNSIENKLMLIDSKGIVRGYYNGADVDEIDRLMAEIRILDYSRKNSAK
jgi:protein SCO1/2